MIAVRGDLVDEWALPAAAVVEGESGGLAHRQHVHSVDLDAGNVVAPRVEGRRGGSPLLGGAHAVVVVLADEDNFKIRSRPPLRFHRRRHFFCNLRLVP